MELRTLGRTGLRVSAVAFGCGPVSGLMTGDDHAAQRAAVSAALVAGVNWFDTAPGYGNGTSEANLGRVLAELGADAHVATKVRVPADGDVRAHVRRSLEESLARLRRPRVELLQLHNGITARPGDEPASVPPELVLGEVLGAFYELQDAGLVRFIGLTGTGHPDALRAVVGSGAFDTLQVPYNALNATAGGGPAPDGDADYGNVIAECAAVGMGVFAIRVFAGGALLGQPPSAHTRKTPYFPLALYERDAARALQAGHTAESAVRFVLAHPHVAAAIIGFGSADHVREVASAVSPA